MKKQKKKRNKKYIPKNLCKCSKYDVINFLAELSVLSIAELVREFEDNFGKLFDVSINPSIAIEQNKIIPFHIIKNDEFNLKSRRSGN